MPYAVSAAGYTASGGRLYVSGGISGGAITNRTLSYDPALDAWFPEANANNTLHRGASACGFYRIGGLDDSWLVTDAAEVYPGLDDCSGEAEDVPWLSEAPITAALAADTGLPFDVTFTALPGMTAGSVHTATLQVKTTDELNSLVEVPVTMTVVARSYQPVVDPPAAAQAGSPGETLAYTLQVTNTGNVPAGYDLSLGAHTWASTLSQTSLPALAPGESATFTVQVTIPGGAAGGASETLAVTVTSQDLPSQQATAMLTTRAKLYELFLPVTRR